MRVHCPSYPHSNILLTQTFRNPRTNHFELIRRHLGVAKICRKTCIDSARCDTSKSAGCSSTPYTSLAATLLLSQVLCRAALAEEAVAKYVPGPVHVGPQIWAGAIAATIPFVIGSWEFAKRIIIQRRCQKCGGSGLVMKGRFARKCPECGGFFPWQGWRRFFTSTALPGNGGPLRQPRGQTSIFYKVPEIVGKASGGQEGLPSKAAEQDVEQKGDANIER